MNEYEYEILESDFEPNYNDGTWEPVMDENHQPIPGCRRKKRLETLEL